MNHQVVYVLSSACRYLVSPSFEALNTNTLGRNALFTDLPLHTRLGIPRGSYYVLFFISVSPFWGWCGTDARQISFEWKDGWKN